MKVVGDGNCFYRFVFNFIFGIESNYVEYCVWCMYELVINFLKYISNEIYIVMLSKVIDFKYVFESFIFD